MDTRTFPARDHLRARCGPVPYVVVGLIWFMFLLFALMVPLVEPVFLWVMTQGLLVEMIIPRAGGWWISKIILFIVYMGAGLIAWWLVERPASDPRRVWKRAIVTWLGIQFVYCLTAIILIRTGVIYE